MSRLRGCVAAGQRILSKKPALLAYYGQYACILAACVVLVSVGPLNGAVGTDVPVPPRKPGQAVLASAAFPVQSNPIIDTRSAKPLFGGQQMDLYRDIFRYQAAGRMDDADILMVQVRDKSLMGHVLAQRFLHPAYKANFDELKNWMTLYADHPEAGRIQRLANARRPGSFKGQVTQATYEAGTIEEREGRNMSAKAYASKVKRNKSQESEATAMINSIRHQVQIYEPSNAMRTLNESMAAVYLDDVEKDRLKALIASGYLYAGNMERARALSAEALSRSKGQAPMAGWVYGLSLWRAGNYGSAAAAFESTAHSPYSTGWMVSAASFWAARAYDKTGHSRKSTNLLERAADYPRTFYGLLALQTLGEKPDLNWDAPSLSRAEEKAILSTPAGYRAEKLIAAGEVTLAEAEIKSLYIRGDHIKKKELLAYAYDRRLPSLTLQLAHAQTGADDVMDAALYPAMPWTPNAGYRIDRALMHAIIRQESRFNATAENKGSGATGLMQLMPATADYILEERLFKDKQNRHLLKNPEVSLELGQKYVEHLLNNRLVGQDLLSLAIAYNAGPGTLQKWKSERPDITDPLLFIETIPFHETRTYVQRVLANYWIYRMRFDQSNESMQALAEGHWARYASLDKGAVKFASAQK